MLYSVRMRATGPKGEHISGAEGIYDADLVQGAVNAYNRRALEHPRGRPHDIFISVEQLKTTPLEIGSLRVRTLICGGPEEAEKLTRAVLTACGIKSRAISSALKVVTAKRSMRGAAVVDAQTGKRLDADRKRGVRATRMGISKAATASLSRKLACHDINTDTVKEALVLASKIASGPGVVAELCISDDPHYTTGYVSSPELGYLRIPSIKEQGASSGGRAIFVSNGEDVSRLIRYLEETPVLVARSAEVKGVMTLNDILTEEIK